ncbi:eukaryotic translation initiation factor 4 gamma 3-like isoform X2 [Periplaneta americana]|uniref:eukaryotic translation initiation factor 4 gamma 3-like isoform X2 n=1 Tax=Periplaneta americana TaxID=6978 RepID=UPI0037E75B06
MVSRYGGRKEPTMHCFMSHCAHPPPQHPPPPLSQFRIISANAGRADVGFHVSSASFPQQGGGAGPPNTQQMRAMHHTHHAGNPPIAPPHQQQAPQQAQSQHTGGPPGPAPTSTPPGPTDMGKQGPPHMQGQPSLQQGGPMAMNFVANQSRAGGSQPFYSTGPRGPGGPRMPNHRGQVVSMQTNNVGQQMYPPHVQVPQVSVYGQQVLPTQVHTPQIFMQSQLPMFTSQPRHGNSAGSGYYTHTPPQQILMAPPQVYPGFQHPSQSPQYYYQGHVSLPRAGGGVTGGPGPGGLAGAASQTVMPGGGPPAQMGQPGGPVMSLVQATGGVVGVAGLSAGDSATGQTTASTTTGKQTRRKHALDVVDPKTMKNVDIYEGSGVSSNTPPHSGESSARGTPQPTTVSSALNVAADFAARVAKAAASEKSPPSSPPSVAQVGPPSSFVESPPQVVTANGPDPSGTNSISLSEGISQSDAHAISKQQIVVEESSNLAPRAPPTIPTVTDTPSTWKQSQHSTSTSLGSKSSGNNSSKSDISNQAVADEKEIDPQVTEFVPSVSATDIKISSSPPVTNKDTESTPVVSAQTNAPTIDVVRNNRENSRESFPALKSSASQSPRRKQHVSSQPPASVPQATITVSSPSTQPSPPVLTTPRETTPIAETKATKKPTLAEDSTPSSFPVSQPPKEKRDQEKPHGRDREKSSSISSQGRSEREKSVSSSSSSSQHPGRDREKSSRDKDKGSTAPQGGQKDRDKSASLGRDRDKSSTKEATPVPSTTSAVPQPQLEQPTFVAVEEPKQQTNGEMIAAETTEGGKASQRSKSKQSRHHKMRDRDLNRKGAEKEGGSDMDAFVEPSSEEATLPVLPVVPSQPSVPTIQSNKVADNQSVKDEEAEVDKEEKLVAARNEENTKVSAAALKEDASSSTPVIETTTAMKTALKRTYKEDQWSPLNLEGKKKYERDFLMELQNDPQSKKKPENLPDLEIVLKDNTNRRMGDRSFSNIGRPVPERSSHDTFTPGFMRQNNQRQPIPKRNSQQGSKAKGNKSNPIHITLSLKEDVKLRETENAWKPGRMKPVTNNEQDAKTEDLYKKVRGVLNKLTPQKFSTLVSQVKNLPIDNSERLQGVINLVFEKAVDEPSFSVAYAQMCKVLSGMQVPAERKNKDEAEFVNFRKLLVNRCQMEFEKNSESELNRGAKQKEIEQTTDPEKKKELQLNFEEEERRIRMKSVGNIRFIGELFKLGMLTTNIMQRCIKHLLSEGDEESLECLCKLLTTIGKDLESKNQDLSQYFSRMKDTSQKRGEVSSRVRFMLQDVIDLRQNNWVPRRDESNPKTMDQIQREAETERMDQQLLLNSAPPTPRRQDDRAPQNRKSRGGGGGGMDEDGWNKVTVGRPSRYTVDTTKLKPKESFDPGLSLGGSYLFSGFGHGASMKGAKDSTKKPMTPAPGSTYSSSNMYAALENSNDDGRRPPPLSSSRPATGKTTPSSSMEKERMLAPFKSTPEADSLQSRSGTSRSSSRDNSRRNAEDSGSLRSSQPASVSASSEDISGTKSPVVSSAPLIPTLTLEEVQKKTLNLLEEFLLNNSYKESGELIAETFSSENLSTFVRESLNDMLERKSSARQNVGGLLSHVVKAGILTLPTYLTGLNEFLECADDIAIDVPKFWPYLAEVIVPMLLSEAMSFANLREVAQPSHGKLILEILQLLVKDKGPRWIREKWDAAGLKWTDFLPADQVDDFIKQNNLEYTVGGAVPSPHSSSAAINWDHVQQKLEQFLKPEQASPPSFDQICDWIGANVGDQVKEPKFIRALMTAICRSAIESQKSTWKLNESHFQQHQKLVLKYVDNNEALELQCLYAVQSLINKLEHPQGLLCQIFQVLWDDSTISNDSFIAWESSTDPAEQGGKGVALKSLTTFFTALREGDEDSSCEES